MKQLFSNSLVLLILFILGWLTSADIVFRFRHPWATETERFLHIPDALMFKKVPYNQMRPRE